MRWKSHVQCGAGEKVEIISKSYLSLSNKLIQIIEQYKLYKYDYDNNTVSEFASKAYEFVSKNNISDGSRPKDPAAREEIWVMIYRLHKFLDKQ